MNKFAASLVFAAVAATAAFSAQAADSKTNTQPPAQQGALPMWQRAAHATQNFTSQIDQQPGRSGVVAFRAGAQESPVSHATTRGQLAANADQNYAAQIDQQPGRDVAE